MPHLESGDRSGSRRRPLQFLTALIIPLASSAAFASPVTLSEALQHLRSDDVLVADAAVEEVVAASAAGAGAAADSLLGFLGDARRDVRAGAIRGLGLLGDARAIEPISGILRDSLGRREPDTFDDRYFRILAIQALGRLGSKADTDLLADAALGDSFERAHAGVALFRIGDARGEAMTRESLSDSTMAIRNLVVEGLGEIDSPVARDLVLSATRDPSWVVRDTAFRSLRRWSAEPAVREALARGAQDPSWFVRATVAESSGTPAPARSTEGASGTGRP